MNRAWHARNRTPGLRSGQPHHGRRARRDHRDRARHPGTDHRQEAEALRLQVQASRLPGHERLRLHSGGRWRGEREDQRVQESDPHRHQKERCEAVKDQRGADRRQVPPPQLLLRLTHPVTRRRASLQLGRGFDFLN